MILVALSPELTDFLYALTFCAFFFLTTCLAVALALHGVNPNLKKV